jgi:hypothetical protein
MDPENCRLHLFVALLAGDQIATAIATARGRPPRVCASPQSSRFERLRLSLGRREFLHPLALDNVVCSWPSAFVSSRKSPRESGPPAASPDRQPTTRSGGPQQRRGPPTRRSAHDLTSEGNSADLARGRRESCRLPYFRRRPSRVVSIVDDRRVQGYPLVVHRLREFCRLARESCRLRFTTNQSVRKLSQGVLQTPTPPIKNQ